VSEKPALESPEADRQGWYYRNKTSEAVRVRLSIVDRSLLLHTLSDRLIASWSLDRLENREVLGESPLVIANLRTPIWYSKATETIRSFAKSLLDCVPSALVSGVSSVLPSPNRETNGVRPCSGCS
jgi:hypothetical protein